jgi:hypothetical protein
LLPWAVAIVKKVSQPGPKIQIEVVNQKMTYTAVNFIFQTIMITVLKPLIELIEFKQAR